jgi:hypothetical protein
LIEASAQVGACALFRLETGMTGRDGAGHPLIHAGEFS